MRRTIFEILILLLLPACTKLLDNTTGNEQKRKADAFRDYLIRANTGFHPTEFYSDKPVDYDESDSVIRQETQLWRYVRPYIIDDTDVFKPANVVAIKQGDIKWLGSADAELQRQYVVSSDAGGIYLDFIDFNYAPLKYTLVLYDSTSLLMYVNRGDAKLFSKFNKY